MLRDIQAVAMLSGTILGVGIFSLPFLLHAVGFFPILILIVVLGALILFLQRAVGHMVAGSEGTHLIPGYIGMYLGPTGKALSFFVSLLAMLFAMVAYLIAGSIFLADLFQESIPLSPAWWALGMFLLGGYFILRGARTVARAELVFLGIFVLLFVLLLAVGIPAFHTENLSLTHIDNPFLAFGGILFALWGMSVIPELKSILGPDEKRIKRVITASFIFTLLFTVLFMVLIAGITGTSTTPDGLTGLVGMLNSKITAILFLFGFIAVFTSYMSLGVTFRDAMHEDFHIPWSVSFIVAAFAPFLLYILGITSLIGVISIVGIVFLAGEGILLSLSMVRFLAMRRERFMHMKQVLFALVILALLGGAGIALKDFFTSSI